MHLEKLSLLKTNFKLPNLLFFQPKGYVVHFIDVKPHPTGSTWFDRDLLEIVYSNWPWLLQFLKDVQPLPKIPDEKVHDLNKRMVSIIDFHGGALMPTTFGVATSGNSSMAVMDTNHIFKELRRFEEYLQKNEEEIKKQIHKETGITVKGNLDYELIVEGDSLVAREKDLKIKINLLPYKN